MSSLHGGQFLIIGVPGPTLDPEFEKLVLSLQPAGFILFARNITGARQLRTLTDQLRALLPYPPFFCLDQEGGRVARLKTIGTEPPSAEELGRARDPGLVRQHGELTGQLLRYFGFNWNLAPVLDLTPDHGQPNSLQGRTFGKDPQAVALLARAFVEGQARWSVLSCGKHFPGYTPARLDPHFELPQVDRSIEELEAWEWRPFASLIHELPTLMVAHIANPKLDPEGLPATLSSRVIEECLRKRLGFGGCVVTDDLDMGAITRHFPLEEAASRALQAGADFLLLCHSFLTTAEKIAAALEKLPSAMLEERAARIERLRARLPEPIPFSHEDCASCNDKIAQLREEVRKRGGEGKESGGDTFSSPVEGY
ncbi:Beta-hexosaminidase [Candidatus Methylacidithermus pantelleriae]|uniref:Beta-hexosaminidase n=2 Tax=Candidatus Methylacidithermus pantelleriae TaxID=2744239 RepID=A0A8J2BU33_9BACT|nr:Beta-hexosaminidase [Candidatus Methylacidithermus pantelleriae]